MTTNEDDTTFPDDFLALKAEVDALRTDVVALEEHLLRFILIVQRFITNPKIKAALGGSWSSDPNIQAILREVTSGTDEPDDAVPGAPEAPGDSEGEPIDR